MTGNSDKVRSLILTALMVFSVFAGTVAFSGGAAAAANVSVEQATEYDDGTVELALNSSTGSAVTAQDIDVYIDGNENPDNFVSGLTVTDDGQDGRLAFDLDQDVQPNRNLTIKVSNLAGGDGTVVAEDIDVTSQTITTTGSNDTDFNAFRGEVIAVEDTDADTEDGPSIEVGADSIVLSDTYTDNSEVYTVDTSNLDTGEDYTIEVDDNDEAIFTLSDLALEVNIDDDVGDGANIDDTDTLAVNVSTNRGGEPANATLFNEDDEKVETIIKNLQANNNVVFDFGNVSADDSPYYVRVTDNQTGVTAESDQINVSESDEGEASFETSSVQDEVGDVTNITVQVDNTEDAVINIGSEEDDNYYIQGQLEDDDGDGEVTVQFNSYTAGTEGNGNTVISVPGDDDLDDVEEGGDFSRADLTEDTLEAGSYSMNVTAGTSPDVTSPDSVGTLRLNENSVESMQTWVAPSDADIDDDDIDVYDRIGENLTQSDNIAVEDVVVHQIEASGIEGALAYEEEDNNAGDTTEAFAQAVDTDGETSDGVGDAGLTLYVNRTDVGANADADPIDFGVGDPLTVVEDADNNTYFVAVDTSDAEFTQSGDTIVDEEDTQINATFAVREGPLSDDSTSSSALYSTSERDATLNLDDDGFVTVQAAAGQEVTGDTNVAPGSELEVEMESESDANPFVLRPEATVGPNGTYTATADFSDYSAGTNFTVQTLDVDGDGDFSDEEDGRIVEAETATVSISDQESDGSEVVVDSAQLSDGGFIVIHDSSLLEGEVAGSVVGNSEYLEAGSHEDITVTLDEPMDENFTAIAMPHLDTNGNEAYDFPDADGPYTENGSAVTASANVTVSAEPPETETEPPETETEPPETETEPPETETEPMDTETEVETTAAEGPGFTAAIALIALIAAALLAVRRDN
jgi:surface glycoprotein (TIGR04207 family)/PGF-CTERM protein